VPKLSAKLREAQVPVAEIDGRIKRLFSIHQKLKKQKIDLDQVYDFMALRIVVNHEQDELDALLETAPHVVKSGGRIVIISFMSLEDRKVKEKFRSLAREGRGSILTKRPLEPSEEEVRRNPPSRSAKLRALDDVREVRVPISFIHVKNDWLIAHTHSVALYEAANEPKELHVIDIPGHYHADRIFSVASESIEPIFVDFLRRYSTV